MRKWWLLTLLDRPISNRKGVWLFLFLPCFIEIPVFKANSIDSIQTPQSAASNRGLHGLPTSLLWQSTLRWTCAVKTVATSNILLKSWFKICKIQKLPLMMLTLHTRFHYIVGENMVNTLQTWSGNILQQFLKRLLYFDKSTEQGSWNYFLCVDFQNKLFSSCFQRKNDQTGIMKHEFYFYAFYRCIL